ncbi:MAG: DNA-binding protein [Burkholderiaceae bacterium]|nr:DNA-binding protein [Burkholderiaceae bacterium]MDZ4144726.1 DNA-binding protein [Burkholderiales bacterium]
MANKPVQLTPLAQETRATLPTAEAAAHLSRAQQTLWLWACKESGPIRPVRVMGRLAWPVADLKRLLGVPA